MGLFKPNVEKMERKRNVEGLVKALKCNWDDKYGEYRTIRGKAAEALGKIGDARAVEPLIQALKGKEYDVREAAAAALGMIGDARAVEPLVQALKDNSNFCDRVLKEAAEALGMIGDARAVEPLVQALKDKHPDVRNAAVKALTKIGKPSVELLIHALKDEEPYVRDLAAEYRATDWAMKEIEKSWPDVRNAAAKALTQIGWQPKDEVEKIWYFLASRAWDKLVELGKPSVEPLIQALKDKNWYVRVAAVEALGKIGDARATEPLIQAWMDDEYESSSSSCSRLPMQWEISKKAAEALGKIGEPAVVPLIHALKYRKSDSALEVLKTLGKISVEPLIQALKDEHRVVRKSAAVVLGEIGDKRVVEPLMQALKDNNYEVREAAAMVLGKIGD